MMGKTNPLLCERCQNKSKRTGSQFCDGCIFRMRAQVNAETRERVMRNAYLPRRRRQMAEIVVHGRIESIPPRIPRQPLDKWFEVSAINASGIRVVATFRYGNRATDTFERLKANDAAGLRMYEVTRHSKTEIGAHNGFVRTP